MESLITVAEARRLHADADSAHSFEHVLRVLALAERLGAAEGADLEIVRAAALLHDVARIEAGSRGLCHAELGAQRAREILAGRPADRVEAVAQAIASHRFRRKTAPPSLEAMVLYDADKVDAIGAIGVARAYAVAGRNGQSLWSDLQTLRDSSANVADTLDPEHTPVREFAVKLRLLKDTLYTETGRALAEGRHRFMAEFFDRLALEVRGEA